ADATDLVGHHLLAVARTTQDDAALELAGSDGFGYGPNEIRIIDRVRAICAEVRDLVSHFAQHLAQKGFVGNAGVVGANGNLHDLALRVARTSLSSIAPWRRILMSPPVQSTIVEGFPIGQEPPS